MDEARRQIDRETSKYTATDKKKNEIKHGIGRERSSHRRHKHQINQNAGEARSGYHGTGQRNVEKGEINIVRGQVEREGKSNVNEIDVVFRLTVSPTGPHLHRPRGHGPVVFGDAAPEEPDRHHGQHGEQGFEQGAVDFPAGGLAQMRANDVVEDLPDGE